MNFLSSLKGHVSETLIKILFERAGYRVTRFGIEELFQEIIHLDKKQYEKLALPKNLRTLPDLLVADNVIEKAFLLEVKFRKELNEKTLFSLHSNLCVQHKYWPETYTILLIGKARCDEYKYHQDYIRVLRPGELDKLKPSEWLVKQSRPENIGYHVWKNLSMLQEVFEKFKGGNTDNADLITKTLRDLGAINDEKPNRVTGGL
ncbi:hypothetical protein MNBD_GAMMA20-1833 [hydrothermal vent metagenome]|uniref:Uncharacterized protein n=1 Tax=hydrothermal vent metagenome TaxID=652676 RepID=A0A3B1APW6_9ZZZZ